MQISDRERARVEAADWCARLNGRRGGDSDREFETWLASSALNRQIYSEINELYRFGEGLCDAGSEQHIPLIDAKPAVSKLKAVGFWSLAMVLLSTAGLGVFLSSPRQVIEAGAHRPNETVIAAQTAKRTVVLSDGSHVTLDSNSRVSVDIDPQHRLLRLESGRARFEVAHDVRPFIVSAGNGRVRALGTIFDVSLLESQTIRVDLLRGAVDVSTTVAAAQGRKTFKARLAAGQSASFDRAGTGLTAFARPVSAGKNWPDGFMTFNGTKLGEVVQQANRYGSVKIVVESEALADRPVYGTLKIDDPAGLARIFARGMQLDVKESGDEILLTEK